MIINFSNFFPVVAVVIIFRIVADAIDYGLCSRDELHRFLAFVLLS